MPRLYEILPQIERAGLNPARYRGLAPALCEDVAGAWGDRFEPNRDKAQAMYDERFCRMCKLHLRGARYVSMSITSSNKIQLAKDVHARPNMRRDYFAARERES